MPHSPSPSHREPTLSPVASQFPILLSGGHSDEDAGRSVRVPHVTVPGVKVGVKVGALLGAPPRANMGSQSGGEGGVFWYEKQSPRAGERGPEREAEKQR